MPRVTIGVPVYNAESLLEQCLENLAAQSFRDFKVIVLDNASTDGTADVATRFAAKDPRFGHQRQPQNKGARQNFVDALGMADTPYFMWRADDDLSDVNFVEELVRLLDAHPKAVLAVGRSVLDKRGRSRLKTFPQRWPLEPAWSYRIRLLLRSRSSWMFGLYRTEALQASVARVASYRHVNAWDHLTMFPFVVTMRVVGSNKTSFITGYIERETSAKKGSFMDPRQMQALRQDFLNYCTEALPTLIGNRGVANLMTPVLWLYAERTYRWVKVMRARSRVMMGEKPFGATTKYD